MVTVGGLQRRRAGVVFPLEVVVVAIEVRVRRTRIEATLSPAHVVRAGVHVEHDLDVVRIRGPDDRLEREPRIGDAHRGMILQHVARALRIVGVERLRNQRQPDHVDAHAGDFRHGLLDRAAGALAAVRPGRVADVLLHRRAARVGRVVGRLMPSFESEPGSATHREHRAVLGDAARGLTRNTAPVAPMREWHGGRGRAQRRRAVVERGRRRRVAARREARGS